MEMYESEEGGSPRGAQGHKAENGTDWTKNFPPPTHPLLFLFVWFDSDKRDAQASRSTNKHRLISPMRAKAERKGAPHWKELGSMRLMQRQSGEVALLVFNPEPPNQDGTALPFCFLQKCH